MLAHAARVNAIAPERDFQGEVYHPPEIVAQRGYEEMGSEIEEF
jgi:hypothetical protein